MDPRSTDRLNWSQRFVKWTSLHSLFVTGRGIASYISSYNKL